MPFEPNVKQKNKIQIQQIHRFASQYGDEFYENRRIKVLVFCFFFMFCVCSGEADRSITFITAAQHRTNAPHMLPLADAQNQKDKKKGNRKMQPWFNRIARDNVWLAKMSNLLLRPEHIFSIWPFIIFIRRSNPELEKKHAYFMEMW